MATQFLKSERFNFHGTDITVMYYQEDDYYTFKISHVIKEPNGNLYKPGGGTSMARTLEDLDFQIYHCYLSEANFYEGCTMVYNEDF